MNNTDIDFQARNLQWRSYITGNIFPIIRQIELIGKKEFAAVALDSEHEAFIVHIIVLSVDPGDEIHPSKRAQIIHLKANEVPTKVSSKYADFADVFFSKLAIELLEHMGINDHAIELVDN